MAAPNVLAGQQIYIKIETSEGSGTFTHPCLINAERGVQFTSQTGETYVPDCDNPDLPAIRHIHKTGRAVSVSGAGVLDLDAIAAWEAWAAGDDAKTVQIWFGTHGYIELDLKLTDFSISGERGGKATVSVTLESHSTIGSYQAQ